VRAVDERRERRQQRGEQLAGEVVRVGPAVSWPSVRISSRNKERQYP
jgi:hypothetical protein